VNAWGWGPNQRKGSLGWTVESRCFQGGYAIISDITPRAERMGGGEKGWKAGRIETPSKSQ